MLRSCAHVLGALLVLSSSGAASGEPFREWHDCAVKAEALVGDRAGGVWLTTASTSVLHIDRFGTKTQIGSLPSNFRPPIVMTQTMGRDSWAISRTARNETTHVATYTIARLGERRITITGAFSELDEMALTGAQDKQGFWVGSSDRIERLSVSGKTRFRWEFSGVVNPNTVVGIASVRDGSLWFTAPVLDYYVNGINAPDIIGYRSASGHVSLFSIGKGRLVLGLTTTGGIAWFGFADGFGRIDRLGHYTLFPSDHKPPEYIAAAAGPRDTVWLLSADGTLVHISSSKIVHRYSIPEKGRGSAISSLGVDGDGAVWAIRKGDGEVFALRDAKKTW